MTQNETKTLKPQEALGQITGNLICSELCNKTDKNRQHVLAEILREIATLIENKTETTTNGEIYQIIEKLAAFTTAVLNQFNR